METGVEAEGGDGIHVVTPTRFGRSRSGWDRIEPSGRIAHHTSLAIVSPSHFSPRSIRDRVEVEIPIWRATVRTERSEVARQRRISSPSLTSVLSLLYNRITGDTRLRSYATLTAAIYTVAESAFIHTDPSACTKFASDTRPKTRYPSVGMV